MAYKIAYLEDLDAGSIKRNVEQYGFEVFHIQPQDNFEDTLQLIQTTGPDLLLMDFRLHAGTANFNAPPFAQFFRSQVIDNGRSLPIVLISSEDNIRDYYRDYTSLDLFDFAVDKERFLKKSDKYCGFFNELIDGYRLLSEYGRTIGIEILVVPEVLQSRLDKRLVDILSLDKYQSDPFMVSSLLLSSFIKPIGLLIGPEVLSARLGVSMLSDGWSELLTLLDDVKYKGLYSKSYQRWWSQGIELWWKDNFSTGPSMRRLSADDRCSLISEKFGLSNILPVEKLSLSKSLRTWTICAGNLKPLDPIDGFEIAKDIANSPWLEPEFYSLDFLVNYATQDIIKQLKEQERKRYSEVLRG